MCKERGLSEDGSMDELRARLARSDTDTLVAADTLGSQQPEPQARSTHTPHRHPVFAQQLERASISSLLPLDPGFLCKTSNDYYFT